MELRELYGKVLGLVLSGGGVRGMAHIGAIKALNEYKIYPQLVSGAGTGALVGALYANGTAPLTMLTFFKETPLFKYNFFTTNKAGLFPPEEYLPFFGKYFGEDSFAALEKRLFITATDLQRGIPKTFSSGRLLRPLLASAALPPVFSPVSIGGTLYADGGIMNNFPMEPLVDECDVIIGSYPAVLKEVGKKGMADPTQLAHRTTQLMVHSNCWEKLCTTELLFRPKNLEHIQLLDPDCIEKAFLIGYEHAIRQLERMARKAQT